ncbi:MAG: hypothetical protein MJ068_03110 [Clostridia bacterium]|nr:hypothetical protein [Clostridia bacterium]
MSVIVAVCKDDNVYMGCDTQTSFGMEMYNSLQEATYKIKKFPNGMLVGICGLVAGHQLLCSHPEIFVPDENDELTKYHLINVIVDKVTDVFREFNMLDEYGKMPVSLLIAYKNKVYYVERDFCIIHITSWGASGSGRNYAFPYLADNSLDVRERILGGLRASGGMCEGVSGPFILIDTDKLEYEVVEE